MPNDTIEPGDAGQTLERSGDVDAADSSRPDYEVGYGRPPLHSRFKKGRSGNPRGRPKGKKNLGTALHQELQRFVRITENGRRKQVTKFDAIVKQLVNKAATGDRHFLKFLLSLVQSGLASDAMIAPLSSEADEQVKRDLLERLRNLDRETRDGE